MPSLPYPPRRHLGQHFLHDPGVIRRIIQAIHPAAGEHLVEIGPGLGAITCPLLETTGQMDVVELDQNLIPELQHRCRFLGELRSYHADALTFDFAQLRQDERLLRLVGNLPYNVSTPLLFHLLQQIANILDMHFMLQKEVVERMAANPHEEAYGRLSVMVQYQCRVEPLFAIRCGAFLPPPKVDSLFVRLTPHRHPPVYVHDERRFAAIVRMAFSQRRKMLRRSLKPVLNSETISAAGIDPSARPETLSLADFASLSNLLAADATAGKLR
jgi:16S rRNA (adenine1518-N6/adenine1519-N6)-dimethyltransferase